MAKAPFAAVLMAIVGLLSIPALAQGQVLTLQSGGQTRTSSVHVPASYDAAKAYPVMLVFHGSGGKGAGMETLTGFDAVADRAGFIVAYPESVGPRWEVRSNSDPDAVFVQDLLRALGRSYHVDPTRIYLSGYSQGAGTAQYLVCLNAGEFAGVADVAMNFSQGAERLCHAAPIGYVLFHGTADPVSPYDGGQNGRSGAETLSAEKTAEFWAQIDGCRGAPADLAIPDTLSDGTRQTSMKREFPGCRAGTGVTFYTIAGGGHTWPGSRQDNARLGPTSQSIDASQIIWDTLSAQGGTARR